METAVDQNLTGMGNPLAAKQYSITLVMKLHALTNLLPKDLLPKTLFSTYRLPAHPVERPPKHLVEDLVSNVMTLLPGQVEAWSPTPLWRVGVQIPSEGLNET